eukprot:TRINITY_DN37947_c0_g1_i1.p1 TRINITY_DN37947_c0_g1~~TRINITY_DN37947_c0_g1_i1.p1  ORF type:complete len:303 (+),score=57.44 TRINITY_DN37947_c0_g1_i1:142-1050(+)
MAVDVAGFGASGIHTKTARISLPFSHSLGLRKAASALPFRNGASSIVVVKKNVGFLKCSGGEIAEAVKTTEAKDEQKRVDNLDINAGKESRKWIPVVPLIALPKGERRLVRQDGETIMLLWFRNEVFAVENRSPAEGAYSEGLLNARLTQDGCIVCPTTDSTFSLRTGDIVEWYPKNPVLRFLTPPLRKLFVYPTKVDSEYVYIDMRREVDEDSAEIVFSGQTQAGVTASDVNVDEVRMVVDEGETGFGFNRRSELLNGRAALAGLLFLINFELLTGTGFLKGTGVLDFFYGVSQGVIQRSA